MLFQMYKPLSLWAERKLLITQRHASANKVKAWTTNVFKNWEQFQGECIMTTTDSHSLKCRTSQKQGTVKKWH